MTNVLAVLALAGKDFRIARSYRLGFAMSVFAAFWGLVGLHFISRLVTGGQFAGDPSGYFEFVVVSLVLAMVLETAITAASSMVRQDQIQGTLEYLAAQPVPRLVLGFSWSAYAVMQSLVTAAIVFALTVPLGFRFSHVDLTVAIAAFVLTVVIFIAFGNFGASLVLALQQGGGLVPAFGALLAFLSGSLFPTQEFPRWVTPLTHLSPLTYSLQALRSSLLAHQPATSFGEDLLVLLGFAVVLLPLSSLALEAAFRFAQRRGTLSTF